MRIATTNKEYIVFVAVGPYGKASEGRRVWIKPEELW
jgi:hypothetical protein